MQFSTSPAERPSHHEPHGGELRRDQVSSRVRSGQEVIVNEPRARELVARERARVESMLAELGGEIRAEGYLGRQQPGDSADAGSAHETESVTVALGADLREQLAAVGRAEERIARGTYGRSVESGITDPGRPTRGGTPCRADRRGAATLRTATGPSSPVDGSDDGVLACLVILLGTTIRRKQRFLAQSRLAEKPGVFIWRGMDGDDLRPG